MEIYVLSASMLSSVEEWQRAIDAEGFGLKLDTARALKDLHGHLPAWWKGEPAGFACDLWSARDVMQEHAGVDFGREWTYALAFRWGADLKACVGAYMAAAAYAAATGGLVFDTAECRVKTPEQACETARRIEAETPEIEARLRDVLSGLAGGRPTGS